VNLTVHSSDESSESVSVKLYDESGKPIATATGSAGSAFQFKLDNPKLWSPASPTLYNLTVTLGEDTVGAYTGFRTIKKEPVEGITRHTLNGEVLFAFGTLE
jgi:beta-galactosidase/beta-glucuronidase